MFPYRVQYNESEYDMQNNNLFHKIDQQHQNTFELLDTFEKQIKKLNISFCIIYNFHNTYVVEFEMFVVFFKCFWI